jgi:hypothetical protein
MRLLFAIAALPLIVPAASTARTLVVHSPQKPAELAQSNDNCPRTTSVYAWDRGKQVTPRRLTDLPDANVYASVLRHIGRCEVPVVVRFGVSGGR